MTRTILKGEGFRGIYRGFTITAMRVAPDYSFYFLTYEYMREQLHPGCRKNGQETFRTMFLVGGLAGVVSRVSCYPLDVIKTRIQVQMGSSPLRYNGIVDCFKRSMKEEGYKVLSEDLGSAIIKAFIVNGVVFTGYETAFRFFFTNNIDATSPL